MRALMDVARARRLAPVFKKLGTYEMALLVEEIDALEGRPLSPIGIALELHQNRAITTANGGEIPPEEFERLRKAKAKRDARDARAREQEQRRRTG